ncbi:MAG TPA: hypothetical protein VNK95_22385 [Caldilineaceae bacterium]|nr:hypothetical protein [Caldilineaceae bacterium]
MKESRGLRQSAPLYLACYLFWFAFSAVTVWTLLQFRNAWLGLLPVIGPWRMSAVDKFGLLILGLFAVGWIMFLEDYLRKGVESSRFWRRVRRLALIHLMALGSAYGLQALPLLALSL